MRSTLIFLAIILVILLAVAYLQGVETFKLGWRTSLEQFGRFLPILFIAMVVAGFTEVLLPEDLVENWLSESSGWRGIGIAWLAGIITPGGSLIGLPIIAALYKAGVGVAVLMTYATSFATLSIMRIPLEAGFMGWRLAGLRVLVSLGLPFIVGGLTQLILPFFQSLEP